jgi:hypothetical protein
MGLQTWTYVARGGLPQHDVPSISLALAGRERLSFITRREEDYVIARAKRHELQTPKPHDGAEVKWAKTIRHLGFSWTKRCHT